MHQTTKLALSAIGAIAIYAAPWGVAALSGIHGPATTTFEVLLRAPERVVAQPVYVEAPPIVAEPEPEPEPEAAPPVEAPVVARPSPAPESAPEAAPVEGVAVIEAERGIAAPATGRAQRVGPRAEGRSVRRSVSSRRRRAPRCEAPHPEVRAGRDGVVEVDRTLVDRVTRNLQSFMKLGYSRPYESGEIKGWYISGFSCSSPVHKAGFRRRDVLLRVNGKKTRSWVGVFLMYQKLKKKTDFEVELMRGGEPKTLRFRVVG